MVTQETTVKGRMGKLQRLQSRFNSNRAELGHLEASLARFEALLAQMTEAADRQAFHTAEKQEASKQFKSALVEGERLATVLQLAVKQHYGIRSEKLADFGMKPFRSRPAAERKRKPKPSAPATEPTTPAPSE
ncbi:MAG TPA: hypothetical protein VLE27_08310 [Thermoanaerobaculia bacterium]|nr:hypothetical protein [Thermoanaerobaculia bacterium]